MTQKFFAPSTRAFYAADINPTLPPDAIAISDDLWHQLVTGVNGGQSITVVEGLPTLTAAPIVGATKAQLVAYATAKRDDLLAAGITVNVAASGSPAVPILADATVGSRSDLTTLYVLANASSAFTAEWTDNNNVTTLLTAAEILVLAPAIMAWYQHMIAALSTVIASIEAGTITTTAQVDATAWPTA